MNKYELYHCIDNIGVLSGNLKIIIVVYKLGDSIVKGVGPTKDLVGGLHAYIGF